MMIFTTSPLIPLLILESTVLIECAGTQTRICTMWHLYNVVFLVNPGTDSQIYMCGCEG